MYIIISLMSILVFATVVLGIILNGKNSFLKAHPKMEKRIAGANISFFTILSVFAVIYIFTGNHAFAQSAAGAAGSIGSGSQGLGYLAAGLSTGLATIGAGIGVGITGSAGIGAISEKPGMLGRTLIYVGLAEGIAIYGLIISIMILGRI
ncbi:MAG: ATPase [Spirochaetes bacterium]|nr:ATPase [Spirochaetota bacterium]